MKEKIYLAQTDTTAGFLSKDFKILNEAKKRDLNTPCIITMAEFKELCLHVRVPNIFKNYIRKAKNISFIYPNGKSCRVVKCQSHAKFLKKHKWLYSTSANITCKGFDENYAKMVADEIITDNRGFFEAKASLMLRVNKRKMQKVRV